MKRKTRFSRWFPHPFFSVISAATWLLLNHSLATSDILLAIILAVVVPRMVAPFITRTPSIHWPSAIRLLFTLLIDIVISNFVVAKLVLGPKKNLKPKWFRIPLATQNEQVNALLAMIITTTPGTVSAGIDQKRGDILVHALNSTDTDAEIKEIKKRYEQLLIKIFSAQSGENT
ncbi:MULTISPECIES: Na+/H+ antiporter subunit E [Acinetobacter]|jgi:multicomponent K+:H+ antiporter subunit E|uniref:Na+/H+ antiporter subunit E n=1 Tax=Acinetobacter pollinis TaxID=2605270 RepID=A0ABU6DU51_9GAMM|nr:MULTISPECIES: Na+/H+ antiporter subunit E [Acinetobacter]MBF7689930.1 Na+/H+ antiporter subunit E [Acinetobacter pollinis]MBF7693021.1 Na+/H+ antiporter subunit E [Acinetobacter pollinis]MBF7697401.1 Na+/H+ antiporter subunit E [Acinetobacter pollinis]MBF7699816.1 Na+/H+ antiporter subunit E [Acinetobacter pollinis]MEB5476933.1 Na+/H+ antiporter subunit E [Acinetobacter pollinis]